MDEAQGCARVKVQYGDSDQSIELKDGYGVFGGGWERPANVFTAAESFNKQLKRKATTRHSQSPGGYGEESSAQAEARARADTKIKMERFLKIWSWMKEILGIKVN
ncbi:unnamed protein product [Sphenostylis stenocarpa]|uniref:Uncharacterized protein n=1 Tax=Sphenostylis stenocarpa TaxID=92480 RepID=A0AA86S8J2_9FABA|nr:unnamed protein product [Sphenostylis stenocarpa]